MNKLKSTVLAGLFLFASILASINPAHAMSAAPKFDSPAVLASIGQLPLADVTAPTAVITSNDTAVVTPAPDDAISKFILGFAEKYPIILTILGIMGAMRGLAKPICDATISIIESTPTKKDDNILASVEQSVITKWILYAMNYLFSIKLPTTPAR